MNSIDQFRPNADSCPPIGTTDYTRQEMTDLPSVAVPFLNNKLLGAFRLSIVIGGALIASGLYHLALLWVTSEDWSGPISLRKPGLFGVSAGVTVWSIAWVLTQLVPHRNDRRFVTLMSVSLLLEVGLITFQQWRRVPSHFNRTTPLDATIESIMLGLIMLVTAGIAWLCVRSFFILPMPASRAISMRAGLWLLLFSCGLGFLVTIAGQINLATGLPPETWGKAGVLKYPHGAALHAIQVLPLLSLLLQRLQILHAALLLRLAVAAQILFLIHALWQTINGRSRLDIDLTGISVLAVAALVIVFIGRSWPVSARS
ncbi:MAG: hypothetical protein WCH39_06890 [Schlesneria sp.]